MNIFEQAVRKKIRFSSVRGDLNIEQLFGLPLTSNNGFNLDDIAREAHRELQELTTTSFVGGPVEGKEDAELRLELVKAVIADTQEKNRAKIEAKERAQRKQDIMEAIARSERNNLEGKSTEDLKKMLESL